MRALPLLVLLLSAGCASAGDPGLPTSQTSVVSTGMGDGVMLARDKSLVSASLAWDPARVWPLVLQAYTDIGIPVDHVDHQGQVATATNQRVRRLMGKGPGSYFTCAGPFGNTANRDDVYLTVRTQVVPGEGTGSIVRIGAGAVARSTTSANTVTDCASNGELEKLIAQKISERTAG